MLSGNLIPKEVSKEESTSTMIRCKIIGDQDRPNIICNYKGGKYHEKGKVIDNVNGGQKVE